MRDRFFKFLKDHRAYDAWMKGIESRFEGMDAFLTCTPTHTWIGGAFKWSSYPGVNWSDLSVKWHEYLKTHTV